MSLRLAAYGEFDCDFGFDSQEWSCSHVGKSKVKRHVRILYIGTSDDTHGEFDREFDREFD